MGTDDRMENKGENLGGKVKEGIGRATGNERLEAEGHKDQTKAEFKDLGEDVKDAFRKDTRNP
jgi:uncharacterized protein YjbJ (UPF0337 family)